jgi:hypothetical protein
MIFPAAPDPSRRSAGAEQPRRVAAEDRFADAGLELDASSDLQASGGTDPAG